MLKSGFSEKSEKESDREEKSWDHFRGNQTAGERSKRKANLFHRRRRSQA